jgi:hypothetical protein
MSRYNPKKIRLSNLRYKMKIYPSPIEKEESLFCLNEFFSKLNKEFSKISKIRFLRYELANDYSKKLDKIYKDLEIIDIEKNVPVGIYTKNMLFFPYLTKIKPIEKEYIENYNNDLNILLASKNLMENLNKKEIFYGSEVIISPFMPKFEGFNINYEHMFSI